MIIALLAAPSTVDAQCSVTVRLDDAASVSRVEFNLDYTAAIGVSIDGPGGEPDCELRIEGFADLSLDVSANDTARLAQFTITAGPWFDGATDMVRCRIFGTSTASPELFKAELIEATDPGREPIVIAISVATENCTAATTTTTSTTTTSTTTTTGGGVTTTSFTTTTSVTTTTVSGPTTTTTMGSTTTTTMGPLVLCGDANMDGQVKSSDALAALRTSVGISACPLVSCDVDNSGRVTASDALAILIFAVGGPADLVCP